MITNLLRKVGSCLSCGPISLDVPRPPPLDAEDPSAKHRTATSSELPPEVWIRIFEFVKRDVPSPWRYADWSDLHQTDLASVCRVSLVSRGIVAPAVFDSCRDIGNTRKLIQL
jgi:hypothetical protein